MKLIKTIIAILTMSMTAAVAAPAVADSLWNDNSSMFSDRKARRVGDLLMVRISERFSDSDEGKISASKSSGENVNAGTGILDFIRAFGFGSSSQMSGSTKVDRTKSVNMVVSCVVTEVLPNGNMVIQGERSMVSGPERMNVTYSGVVSPRDVAHNNVVDSTKVVNSEVIVNGNGVISRTQRPGLIGQIVEAVF
ncbi:MAG: flagellar basal body L-ring protein FlgH [Synergistaceae bacterium]|jgi:flagellar L-ring protein precursor FlgH|nr:flagellar basal body L-ring protein FlgH [Synergistaceae bacterium]